MRRAHNTLLSVGVGLAVTKDRTNTPFPPNCTLLGFTSTSPSLPQSPTSSATNVSERFSVHLKATFTSLRLLFLITPNLMSRMPSSFASSLVHLISGTLGIKVRGMTMIFLAPSKLNSKLPLTQQLGSMGILAPTTKLQTPFCMALNLYSSKYSKVFSFRTPKMYQGSSEKLSSSKITRNPMIRGCSWAASMTMPSFRSCTVPQTHSPKSTAPSDTASTSSMA